MSVKNFDLKEVIYCGGDDPEEGTIWRNWWDGAEPKIPSYFAHLMYWMLYEASDHFIRPDGNWDNCPEPYKPNDAGDASLAIEHIKRDINHFIEISALSSQPKNGYFIEPYDFEHNAWNNEFLRQHWVRSLAVYVIYCVDTAIGGLLANDAPLSAFAVASAYTGLDTLRWTIDQDQDQAVDKGNSARSELGRHAATYRHEPTKNMKHEAVRLYREGNWPSRLQAAKAIFPLVQSYGQAKYNHKLSADRGEQTVYEWLTRHDKST